LVTMLRAPEFNLDNYIAQYTDEGKIQRLLFVAKHAPQLTNECHRRITEELKNRAARLGVTNTSLYKELKEKLQEPFDVSWLEITERRANQRQDQLQNSINTLKSSSNRESTRLDYIELGDFYAARGEFQNAVKCYYRCREHNSTHASIIQMCMKIVKIHTYLGNINHAQSYISRAQSALHSSEPDIIAAQINCCLALSELAVKQYKSAARKFIDTPFVIGSSFSDIISPEDISTYACVCGLATFSRDELKTLLINNQKFKSFLELTPVLREIITGFYQGRYSDCLQALESLKPTLLLDIYFREHVESLYADIRVKALIQYSSPFSSVNIITMAESFNCAVSDLESELSKLIMEDKIQARIDSHSKVLYARYTDRRATTFQQALLLAGEYQQEMAGFILRTNLLQRDFIVRARKETGTSILP